MVKISISYNRLSNKTDCKINGKPYEGFNFPQDKSLISNFENLLESIIEDYPANKYQIEFEGTEEEFTELEKTLEKVKEEHPEKEISIKLKEINEIEPILKSLSENLDNLFSLKTNLMNHLEELKTNFENAKLQLKKGNTHQKTTTQDIANLQKEIKEKIEDMKRKIENNVNLNDVQKISNKIKELVQILLFDIKFDDEKYYSNLIVELEKIHFKNIQTVEFELRKTVQYSRNNLIDFIKQQTNLFKKCSDKTKINRKTITEIETMRNTILEKINALEKYKKDFSNKNVVRKNGKINESYFLNREKEFKKEIETLRKQIENLYKILVNLEIINTDILSEIQNNLHDKKSELKKIIKNLKTNKLDLYLEPLEKLIFDIGNMTLSLEFVISEKQRLKEEVNKILIPFYNAFTEFSNTISEKLTQNLTALKEDIDQITVYLNQSKLTKNH